MQNGMSNFKMFLQKKMISIALQCVSALDNAKMEVRHHRVLWRCYNMLCFYILAVHRFDGSAPEVLSFIPMRATLVFLKAVRAKYNYQKQ